VLTVRKQLVIIAFERGGRKKWGGAACFRGDEVRQDEAGIGAPRLIKDFWEMEKSEWETTPKELERPA